MKEADMDCMGVKDIACMMMQNCFTDPALKAKLGAEKTPTLETFDAIIKSQEAGKKAASMFATANTIKPKFDKGKGCQNQAKQNKKTQISNAKRANSAPQLNAIPVTI